MNSSVKAGAEALSVQQARGTAWLDLIQGVSGGVLVLFMWVHMFLVSSILLGKDAMYLVTRALEGEFIFGRAYPALVNANEDGFQPDGLARPMGILETMELESLGPEKVRAFIANAKSAN